MIKKFLLIGAKPDTENTSNPGGQVTASISLTEFAKNSGYGFEVIDTTQSSFPIPPLSQRIKRGLNRLFQLNKLINAEDISGVIIFSSSGFSFYERIVLSILCRIKGTSDIFFIRSGHFMTEVSSSRIIRFIASILLRIPTKIGAQGSSWVSFYQQLGVPTHKITIIRNWLPNDFPICTEPKIANPDVRLRFIFVGWMVKKKGVSKLLEAVNQLKRQFDFELVMIGGGDLESDCKHFVASNNLTDSVKMLGWKDKADVLSELNKSHVFILPSQAEGFPNALLEAMAVGLASICTDVGGISDSLNDSVNGFLLADNNPDTIAYAMKRYLQNPELIEEHSKQTLKLVEELHSRDKNCKLLFDQFTDTYQ